MSLATDLGGVLLFRRMQAAEALGRLFEFNVEACAKDPAIKAADLLGTPASVALQLDDQHERHFHGIVAAMGPLGSVGEGLFGYRLVLRPRLWLLTRRSDTRIFQALSVVDILQQVMEPFGIDLALRLNGDYAPREYCVQYRESDFNFISRLMEQVGIYYFFEHSAKGHTLVLVDAGATHAPCALNSSPRFREGVDDLVDEDAITHWEARREMRSGKVVLTDYNFQTPANSLLSTAASAAASDVAELEVYDYPCHFDQPAEGKRFAELRLQELGARSVRAEGAGTVRTLTVGGLFKLKEHPQKDQNIEYLVVATQIDMASSGTVAGDGETRFECRFTALDSREAFRSERLAVATRVAGPHTAVVVGPAGEEIYPDELGRVKVHFHWDRLGKQDENSSCWVRVASPWAGAMRGWVSIPRIGDEVVVDFLEGNPDRPLIVGSVYNASNLPPWQLPANKTQSGLLTRSSQGGSGQSNANVLRFEDKKGSEQVWLHAEKDQLIEVENDEDHTVGHDRRKSVGNDETTSVGHDRTESVGHDETISIGANRSEDVANNETISIGDNRSETVGKDETISIGANRSETVGDNEDLQIGKNRSVAVAKEEKLEVGDNRSTTIGKNDSTQVGKKLLFQAGDEITLVTGSASIVMKKDGSIQIKGKDITIVGSGKIGVKASSNVTIKGSKIAEN